MSASTQRRFVGKLGRKPQRVDQRTLQLANYMDHGLLPKIPQHFDWGRAVGDWGMCLNDHLGCCTIAAASHALMTWSANAGSLVTLPDDVILQTYELVSGYDPKTGLNDDGAVELDVLNLWQHTGIGGHHIGAYVALEPRNHHHVRAATFLFGGVYTGILLPISIQNQDVWAVPPEGPTGDGEPGSLGGHAVPIIGYGNLGVTVVTWGRVQRLTWGFVNEYMCESYAVISPDWFEGKRLAPSGFDLETLTADLAAVQSPNPPTPGPVARQKP